MDDTWYSLTWPHVLTVLAILFGVILPVWLIYEFKRAEEWPGEPEDF